MARRYECPRCGAGTNPADSQCWRCGELLVTRQAANDSVAAKVSAVEETMEQSTLVVLTKEDRKKAEPKKPSGKIDREIDEREKKLLERERKIAQREREVESLAIKIEKGIKSIESSQAEESRKGELKSEWESQDLEKIVEVRDDYREVIEKEKQRLKNQIETQLNTEMKRVEQLEDQLKRIYAGEESPAWAKDKDEVPPSEDLQQVIRKVAELIKPQIGVGLPNKVTETKVQTHIEKLDQILGGGIPEGSVVLVNGPAGSMKSTICYDILHQGAVKDDIKSMYLSLEQDRESIIRQMEQMGLPRNESEDNMIVVDIVNLRKRMQGEHGDWRSILMRYIKNVYDEMHFDLLVMDSLESFIAMTEHPLSREDIQDLFEWIRSLRLTTFLISEKPLQALISDRNTELYVADGAIELMMKEVGDSKVQRWLRCLKMRGEDIDTRYYCLIHESGRFNMSVPMMRSSSSY